jgi:hypothetical protein
MPPKPTSWQLPATAHDPGAVMESSGPIGPATFYPVICASACVPTAATNATAATNVFLICTELLVVENCVFTPVELLCRLASMPRPTQTN